MAGRTMGRCSGHARRRGSMLRAVMLVLAALAAAALALVGWGAWRLERGEPLPDWLARLAVISGLVRGDQLAEAARAAEARRVDDALWRNAAANRARAQAGVRAVAWDGDRLLVVLGPGVAPSGGRAQAICSALVVPDDAGPVRVRLEALDGQGAPVETWCGRGDD